MAVALVLSALTLLPALVLAQIQAPGPESFAKPPKTPMELWDAIDYLARTGQPEKAVPYLDTFLKSNLTDDLLLEIRDRYGAGSILHLEDYPGTRSRVAPLMKLFNDAARKRARDPERLRRYVDALTRTIDEQQVAVDHLRLAGPYAVPYLIEALRRPELTSSQRGLMVQNMGKLDVSAMPALVAALDAPDQNIAADMASVLGLIGDLRSMPFLTYEAARPNAAVVGDPARQAIERLSGRPFAAQTRAPARVLADEATKYLTHKVAFPGDPVELWTWTDAGPTPRRVPRAEAEAYLGARFARRALELDPNDRGAQVALVGLALQEALSQVGVEAFPATDPTQAYPLALAAGPEVVSDVLRLALREGLGDLASAAAAILGRTTDRDAITTSQGGVHPLVEALASPRRRARFAAARALVELDPAQSFPGSSQVVPALAQFIGNRATARAVVIDLNINRANGVASVLKALGYDPLTASDGPRGFRQAAETADVEAIFIEPTGLQTPWKLRDLLANLRADAATAAVPIFLYGPLGLQDKLSPSILDTPNLAFVVTPTDPQAFGPVLFRERTRMGDRPLSPAERQAYAQQATGLLASLSVKPGSPFRSQLEAVEPALGAALNNPPTAPPASIALGDVPSQDAQRRLASLVLDMAQPQPLRIRAATDLSRSLQRFGPLLTADQERRLSADLDEATDPDIRSALAEVIGALRPRPTTVGPRLERFDPATMLSPPASAAPRQSAPPTTSP